MPCGAPLPLPPLPRLPVTRGIGWPSTTSTPALLDQPRTFWPGWLPPPPRPSGWGPRPLCWGTTGPSRLPRALGRWPPFSRTVWTLVLAAQVRPSRPAILLPEWYPLTLRSPPIEWLTD